MKKVVKASSEKEYVVNVNFATYIGVDETYYVTAENEDDAKSEALEEAYDDLEVDEVEDLGEGDWEVSIYFAGMASGNEVYSVYGDDEEEAIDAALELARYDLEAEVVSYEEID